MRLNNKNSLFESFQSNLNESTLKSSEAQAFIKKYNSIYGDLPVVKEDGTMFIDNIRLVGSGISKGIELKLYTDNRMAIYNEEWGLCYDGHSIYNVEEMSQYWFYDDFNNREDFHNKIEKAVKRLYKDVIQLKNSMNGELNESSTDGAININTYISHYEYQPEIESEDEFRSSGDSSYFTVVKNERDAEKFNYHSDYWGSEDEYQEDNVELVSSLESYIESGDPLYFNDEETGEKHFFTVTGIAIDKQYNSISHTKILIKDVNLKESSNNANVFKEAYKYSRHKNRLNESAQGMANIIWGADTSVNDMSAEEKENLEAMDEAIGNFEDSYNEGAITKTEFLKQVRLIASEFNLNDEEGNKLYNFYSGSYEGAPDDVGEDEEFTMYDQDSDKHVRVWKQDGKWYDEEGNRYMGYLTKQDIKKYFKGNWIEESEILTETTNKGIEEKKQALYDRIRQALKDAGDEDWENIVNYVKRLPQEQVDAFDLEEDEIWCIEMIHSILTYTSDRDIDRLIKDRYLQKYIDELGEDKVRELLAGEIEEYKNATINRDVYTDSEGVTYNSVKFRDDE